MTYYDVISIGEEYILPIIEQRYALEGYTKKQIPAHQGGRNVVYMYETKAGEFTVIRISFLQDRSYEDILAEAEYIRYLAENGASVANVIHSKTNALVEVIAYKDHLLYICAFEKAKGKQLAENNYRYRDGVPLTEYFYNCGKTLGKMHQLSKSYLPVHKKADFFDKYNERTFNELLPASLSRLKQKFMEVLEALHQVTKSSSTYGMVHFDYSDGNYMIDYETGQITVYDFDNSCFCWYMFDLANLWIHGTGWIQFEPNVIKRKTFMDEYFSVVLSGYRSETKLPKEQLAQLPLFINAVLIENIIDAIEVMKNNREPFECDDELSWTVYCLEHDVSYKGFFDTAYSCRKPFQINAREL